MRRPILTGLLIAVLVIVGWWGVHHEARQSLERGIARFATSLPPGARFSYAAAHPLLLMRGAELQSVVYHEGATSLTIADLRVAGFSGYPPLGLHLRHIKAHDVRYTDATRSLTMGDIDLNGLSLPPVDRAAHIVPDAGAIVLEDGTADRIQAATPGITSVLIGHARVHDYALGHRSALALDDTSVQTTGTLSLQAHGLPAAPQVNQTTQGALHAHIGQFRQTGVDLASTLSQLLSGRGSGPAASTALIGTQTTSTDALHLDFGQTSVTIAHLDTADDHTADSDHVTLSAHDIAIPAIPADLGGKPGDVTMQAHIDRKRAVMTIDQFEIAVPQAATIGLTGVFDHIPVDPSPASLQQMRLVTLAATYRDAGFVNALLGHFASQHHADVAQVRAGLAQQGQVMRIVMPPLGTLIDYVAAPDGHTLHLGLNPPAPLAAQAIQSLAASNPLARIQALGLSAEIQ